MSQVLSTGLNWLSTLTEVTNYRDYLPFDSLTAVTNYGDYLPLDWWTSRSMAPSPTQSEGGSRMEVIDQSEELGRDKQLQSAEASSARSLATLPPKPKKSLLKSPDKRTLPTKSNTVQFVDTVGKPLTSVKLIAAVGRLRPVASRGRPNNRAKREKHPTSLMPTRVFKFTEPGGHPGFFRTLRRKKVLLISVKSVGPALRGFVKVVQMEDFQDLCVKWTQDQWKTFNTTTCSYFRQSCSDETLLTYWFHLPANWDNMEFAIRYRCGGKEYWDSNGGQNYVTFVQNKQ